MHANVQLRNNGKTNEMAPYYRLKESYRDVRGNVHSLVILNIGFEPNIKPIELHRIARALTNRFNNRNSPKLFGDDLDCLTEKEREYAEKYWDRMIAEGGVDRFNRKECEAKKEAEKYIDIDTVEHTDARNLGAEWLCKQAIDKLELEKFLRGEGWSDNDIKTALSHLIIRTVYSPSEFATHRIMSENSSACELFSGDNSWVPGINSLYKIPDKLFSIKDKIETHLCNKTDHLFNLDNRILLYDLTNFYFEGRKAKSAKAKFGRSKEKRSDCRLLVLALCINKEGFIRYSSILEGNMSDPMTLPDMIETLAAKTGATIKNTLVIMDAGISTEDNLKKIKKMKFNYLCVTRSKIKNYTIDSETSEVKVFDSKKNEIKLRQVQTTPDGDYCLEVTSPTKALTEASMNRQWKERFEEELNKINHAINTKGGVKIYEKVVERTGRAIEKYPSIAKFYNISYVRNDQKPNLMKEVKWEIKDLSAMQANSGVYFLRTNVKTFDEKTTWDYYNLIREIETTNRQLKTDLNLRPIYHQKDSRSDAHIFFGLLSYWVVNTIRHSLKQQGEKAYWTEIVRRMDSQKIVTTKAINALGEKVQFRQCSKPSKAAQEIYDKLGFKYAPFKKAEIRRSQRPPD